ncbi:MAG: type secretion inner rane ring lipoprotein SctJ [Pseudomonadota bacterium]|jgi:type III secretion protein J
MTLPNGRPLQSPALLLRWLASMALALMLAACGAKVDLLGSIAEADANEVIAALLNAGIQAEKVPGKEGMVGVRVEQAKTAQAVDTLRQLGLPRERFAGMGQVFKKDGLISSPLEERARYLYALSQDLSSTLTRIDGVLFARVHLVLPERGSADEGDTRSSAAVFIKHQRDIDLEVLQPQVRRMVVNSIPDLATERVSVVLIPSSQTKPSRDPNWVSFMGYRVEPAAAGPMALWLAALALLAALGAGSAAYLAWRHGLLGRLGLKPNGQSTGRGEPPQGT